MDKIICYIFIIGLTIKNLVLCFCGGTEEQEIIARAMDLVFLRAYEEHVRAHVTHRIDELEQIQFFNTWEPILGVERANAIFERTQIHLKYALVIANNAVSNDISALVIAIHSRVLALYQGVNYLKCILFAQFHALVTFRLEHCQNIATHLLIFGQLGLEKLMKKFQSLIEILAKSITDIEPPHGVNKIMASLPGIPASVGVFIKPNLFEEDVLSAALRSTVLQESIIQFHRQATYDIEKHIFYTSCFGLLLLDINSGTFENCRSHEGYRIYSSRYQNDILFWTDTSAEKNEKLQHKSPSITNQLNYDIPSLLRENVIQRAAAVEVDRRKIVEIFERVKPDYLVTNFKDRRLVSNARLLD